MLRAARAPYSLEPTAFSFPALAAMGGRSPLGGPRELALACLVVCRLVRDAAEMGAELSEEQRRHRSLGAKHWLGAAAIQAPVRTALSRVADAVAAGDFRAVRAALDGVMTVTANSLDQGARLELARLAQAIAE
jgi:hypothetical protein